MKTTLDLPDELIREVKLRAVVQGRTVKDLVADFLRLGLGLTTLDRTEKRPTSERVEIRERGLPVIRCRPDAPSTLMRVEALLKLEQDAQEKEDLKRAGLSL